MFTYYFQGLGLVFDENEETILELLHLVVLFSVVGISKDSDEMNAMCLCYDSICSVERRRRH